MKCPDGFSLVEVMCAIAILGLSMLALTQGMTTALRSSKEGELQTVASLYASGKVETLRVEGDLTDGQTEGDCGDALPLYRWKQTIARTTLEGLHEVTVEVDDARKGTSIYELKTMLFEAPDEPLPQRKGREKPTSTSSSRRRRERP